MKTNGRQDQLAQQVQQAREEWGSGETNRAGRSRDSKHPAQQAHEETNRSKWGDKELTEPDNLVSRQSRDNPFGEKMRKAQTEHAVPPFQDVRPRRGDARVAATGNAHGDGTDGPTHHCQDLPNRLKTTKANMEVRDEVRFRYLKGHGM